MDLNNSRPRGNTWRRNTFLRAAAGHGQSSRAEQAHRDHCLLLERERVGRRHWERRAREGQRERGRGVVWALSLFCVACCAHACSQRSGNQTSIYSCHGNCTQRAVSPGTHPHPTKEIQAVRKPPHPYHPRSRSHSGSIKMCVRVRVCVCVCVCVYVCVYLCMCVRARACAFERSPVAQVRRPRERALPRPHKHARC